MSKVNDELLKKLYEQAKLAREKSYSPYSKFQVGAALVVKGSDQIFSGCNVENVSFGSTICAERTAIFKFVSEIGKATIEHMVLITDADNYDTPCGGCLQVMNEFADESTQIYLSNMSGIQKAMPFYDLMPIRFDKSRLKL